MGETTKPDRHCECVSCAECRGSGSVWFAFPGPNRGGEYLGNNRCDDLDELETCYECGGSGTTDEMCGYCQDQRELEDDQVNA